MNVMVASRRRAYKLSLAAFVVLTVVWIGSGWVGVWYSTGTTLVGVKGSAVIVSHEPRIPAGFDCAVFGWHVYLIPDLGWIPGLWTIPLWPAALLAGIATIVFGYRSRRIPPGHCKACRYDLTGNISGVCPECGVSTGDG